MVLFLALFRPGECLLEVGARSISARSREAVVPGSIRRRPDGSPGLLPGPRWQGMGPLELIRVLLRCAYGTGAKRMSPFRQSRGLSSHTHRPDMGDARNRLAWGSLSPPVRAITASRSGCGGEGARIEES